MQNYELTERGKIIIAVIIAVLLLVLSVAILAVWNSSPPAEDPPQAYAPEPEPEESPTISDRPLPDGSGLDPLEPEGDVDDEPGVSEPPEETQPETPAEPLEIGPISLDRQEGVMYFAFSPELQDSLDDDTVAMLGEFISSPKNTGNIQIAIEMPNLPDDERATLVKALSDALAQHSNKQYDFVYITYRSGAENRTFEVRLSFLTVSNRK